MRSSKKKDTTCPFVDGTKVNKSLESTGNKFDFHLN